MLKSLMLGAGIVMAVLSMAVCASAGGQGNGKEDSQSRILESMVVTAGRISEKKSDVTTNITVYTREDLEKLSVQDLSDLMVKEGFMVREYPNAIISVGIRGFRTETHGNDLASHVLILINGRRAGTGNLAKISMENVARIEIIRGPGSVQYGASAMGGVINIITRKGGKAFSASIEETLGSWDYQKTAADISGSIRKFDFAVSASKSSQDDYDTPNGTRYYNTGFDSKENIDFNGGFTFAPKNRVGFSFSDYQGDHIGSPDVLSSNNKVEYVDHSLQSFDIYYDGQTGDGFWLWNARYFQGKDEYETFDPATSTTHTYYRDTDNQGFQAQVTAKWDMAHITAGVDWTGYEISNTYTVAGKENTYENPAAFFMAKKRFLDDKLVLSAGGRYDRYEVESDTGKDKKETNWSSSLGAVYKLTTGLSVRANYAEAFRMPTADELFMYNDYSSFGFGIWSGNENLKPESSKTYEAGIDYTKGSLTAGLTWFYTEFKDKISYAYDADEDVTRYENVEGATLSGFEGNLQLDIGAFCGWAYEIVPYVSFAVHDKYEDDATGENLLYVPEWSASYGLRFNNTDIGLYSRLNFTYFGEQNITDYEETGETTLGKDTVADFSISKRLFSLEKYGQVSLKGEITNLFNESYALVQGYPSPGRTFYLGMSYSF